jgi:hypothetical protein
MDRAHIDITRDLDGQPVVHALFDLREDELVALRHAVSAAISEEFRSAQLSTDEILQLRELTAAADELDNVAGTVVVQPARLRVLRQAVTRFIHSRDEAEWVREEDAEALAALREMQVPLEQLCGEALHAALSPESRTR